MSGNNRLVKPSTLECFLAGLQDQYLNFCKHTAMLFLVKVELDFRILQLSDSSNNIFNEADTGDFEAVCSVLL